MRKLTLEQFNEKLHKVHPNEDLTALSYDGDNKECEVICNTCGTHYKKKAGCSVDKRKVSICKKCFPTHDNIHKKIYQLPEGYSYVEPYKSMQTAVLIRHDKCGFIWKVKPNNLKYGKGCPKCNRKVSKGEQKIASYLDTHKIKYEAQKKVELEGHHLTVDFYLPKFDLYIEYNGIQHYESVKFFGGEEKLEKQQELDALKQKYLKDKLLIISYKDFDNIESILESSTTIPNGK